MDSDDSISRFVLFCCGFRHLRSCLRECWVGSPPPPHLRTSAPPPPRVLRNLCASPGGVVCQASCFGLISIVVYRFDIGCLEDPATPFKLSKLAYSVPTNMPDNAPSLYHRAQRGRNAEAPFTLPLPLYTLFLSIHRLIRLTPLSTRSNPTRTPVQSNHSAIAYRPSGLLTSKYSHHQVPTQGPTQGPTQQHRFTSNRRVSTLRIAEGEVPGSGTSVESDGQRVRGGRVA